MGSRRRLRRRWRDWLALFTRLPGGPAPLAARGLPAVLARAGPAGRGRRCVHTAARPAPPPWSRADLRRSGRYYCPAARDAPCLFTSSCLYGLDPMERQEVGTAFSGGCGSRRRQEEAEQAAPATYKELSEA